jgi:hypothetical protein
MGTETIVPATYPIEISGWNVDSEFFVERADLRWNELGEKRVSLRQTVRDGSVVFVRLVTPKADSPAVPIAYQAQLLADQRSRGAIEMKLVPCRPRVTESEHNHSRESQLQGIGAHEK